MQADRIGQHIVGLTTIAAAVTGVLSWATVIAQAAPAKENEHRAEGKKLRLQVVKTLPNPVIHKKSPGTENIPGGFEGGSSVKVTIDGKSEYHFIATAYPKLDWSQSKLDHWVSGDGVNFQHAGVVLENYRDEKAGMNHIFCSPIPYYDEKSARWHLFYCEFVNATTWASESGIMWCAASKTAGVKGIKGPYDFPGHKTFVDGRYIPKEFVPVANSGPYQVKDGRWATLICPHVLGETTRKIMLGDGKSAQATKVQVEGAEQVKWVGGWPIAVGFAATPLGPFSVDELLLPPMIEPAGFTENPMPMKVRGPKSGREYWVAVFDFLAPESTPFTPKNVFGFAWSEDGVHWPKENGQLINVDDGLAPGEQGWWRGAWAVRTPHQMIDEGDGTYTVFFTGGSTDKFFDGFRAVGLLKVKLVEE